MSFLETPRFPSSLGFNFAGGPMFSTDIVVVGSGFESRNKNWVQALGKWSCNHMPKTRAETDTLIAYFLIAGGRANGFRFKDWTDFQADTTQGILGSGFGTGVPAYQLQKRYTTGATNYDRPIIKPVTVAPLRNGLPITAGVAPGNYALDSTTGILTFVPDVSKTIAANITQTITAITQANPGVVTAAAHGFLTGDLIRIAGVIGMTQVDNLYFTVTVIDANTFSIGVNTTAYTAYTSGGTATKYGITQTSPVRVYATAHGYTNGKVINLSAVGGMTQVNGLTFTVTNAQTNYFDLSGINGTAYTPYTSGGVAALYPQAADVLTWSGEFDVKARFDHDEMTLSLVESSPHMYTWGQISIVETRL